MLSGVISADFGTYFGTRPARWNVAETLPERYHRCLHAEDKRKGLIDGLELERVEASC